MVWHTLVGQQLLQVDAVEDLQRLGRLVQPAQRLRDVRQRHDPGVGVGLGNAIPTTGVAVGGGVGWGCSLQLRCRLQMVQRVLPQVTNEQSTWTKQNLCQNKVRNGSR